MLSSFRSLQRTQEVRRGVGRYSVALPGTLPINDSFGVKKLEAADDLGCVEAAGRQSEGR